MGSLVQVMPSAKAHLVRKAEQQEAKPKPQRPNV